MGISKTGRAKEIEMAFKVQTTIESHGGEVTKTRTVRLAQDIARAKSANMHTAKVGDTVTHKVREF